MQIGWVSDEDDLAIAGVAVDVEREGTVIAQVRSGATGAILVDVAPGPCTLRIALAGETEVPVEGMERSSDELTVPCRIDPTPSSRWLTLAVDVGSDWYTYLRSIGFYDRHPSRAAQAMTDVIRPVLMLDPEHPEQPLFEVNSYFSYDERLSAPRPPE